MIIYAIFTGCINSTQVFQEVELIGSIIPQSDDENGSLQLIAYHAFYGSDELRYSFHEFARTERNALDFEWTLNIPQDEGDGLAIRAWLDTNEDGSFCTPEEDIEYGGTHVFDEIDWIMAFELTLDDPCAF